MRSLFTIVFLLTMQNTFAQNTTGDGPSKQETESKVQFICTTQVCGKISFADKVINIIEPSDVSSGLEPYSIAFKPTKAWAKYVCSQFSATYLKHESIKTEVLNRRVGRPSANSVKVRDGWNKKPVSILYKVSCNL